ncbi:MAG: amino acid adenylation domain-containing protein, partial [Acidobacteria bacterium]|nr:amino acid adenylation domain-containing protein [Acidobacteriota bacterium]
MEGEGEGVRARCVRGGEGHLWCEIEYAEGTYAREWMEALGEEYAEVVKSAVAGGSEIEADRLNLLSTARRQQLLVELNSTEEEYARDKGIHQLFEAQVERTPDAAALVHEEGELSFRELNARANQLAHHLRRCGVGREALVAIYMERSPEMVVALLAILKAGGAYVPLDTMYPYDRLSFMMADAQPCVMLTQERMMARLPDHQARVIYVDSEWAAVATESEANPLNNAGAQNAAYVIYTSGSTGMPKGVIVPHQGLANYLNWCIEAYRVADGQEGVPLHSPLGFDLTVTSLFAPLLTGQSVFLVPEKEGIDGLTNALRSGRKFSLVKLTPSYLDVLNQMMSDTELAGVAGALIIGGEALSGETVSLWRTHAPQTRLINEYGPTETVVGCCAYEIAQDDPETGAVPIGRPIANTEIYLLDMNLCPIAPGVSGELYIGGESLARGYLSHPELTAEKFVPHPHSRKGGERLYRTGDVARYGADGEIEYLGRMD